MSRRECHRCGGRPGSSLIGRLAEHYLTKPIGLGGRQKVGDLTMIRIDPGQIKSPARGALRAVDRQRWEGICLDKALQSGGASEASEHRASDRGRIRESQASVGGAAENNLFVEARLGDVGDENLPVVSCQDLGGLQRL